MNSLYTHHYDYFDDAIKAMDLISLNNQSNTYNVSSQKLTELKAICYEPIADLSDYQPTDIALFHSIQHHGNEAWNEMEEISSDNKWIENTHNFIQWWFPLTEKSNSITNAPALSIKDVEFKRRDLDQIRQIQWMSSRMLRFYEDSNHWVTSHDHNHLRITRIIKSLRLLAGNKPAEDWKQWLFNHLGSDIQIISERSVSFWKEA